MNYMMLTVGPLLFHTCEAQISIVSFCFLCAYISFSVGNREGMAGTMQDVLFFSCNQLFFGILKYAPLNFLWSSEIRLIFVRASIPFLDFLGEEINLFSFYQTLYIIYSNKHLFLFPGFSPLFYFSFLKSNGLSPSIVFLFFCFPTLILLPWALSKQARLLEPHHWSASCPYIHVHK